MKILFLLLYAMNLRAFLKGGLDGMAGCLVTAAVIVQTWLSVAGLFGFAKGIYTQRVMNRASYRQLRKLYWELMRQVSKYPESSGLGDSKEALGGAVDTFTTVLSMTSYCMQVLKRKECSLCMPSIILDSLLEWNQEQSDRKSREALQGQNKAVECCACILLGYIRKGKERSR